MANSAEYDVIINIITGHLEKATKQLRGMAGAVNDVSKANKGATDSARGHNDAINGGVSSANNATRGFSKLRDSINGSNGVVAAYATLATQAFAISAAFNQLRSATQVEQLMRGLEEQSARTGVTLGSTAKNMQAITGYSISMGDAMRGAAQVAAAGFSTSTMEALTQAATNSAVALGRNVPDALDRFIKGTTKLEPELLDEMGIMVKLDQATSQYAQTIGKVPSQLTATEKRTAYLNAVLEESKTKFDGMAAAVDTNPYDKLAAAFTDLIQNSLNKLNDLGVLDFVRKLADNSGFLTAGLIYLGSTVIKQVIPGLYSMAASAAAAAEALRKEAAAQHEAVLAAEQKAATDRAAAIDAAKTLKILDSNKQAYTEYAAAVRAGTDSEEQKSKALNSVRGSMAANTRELNKLLALQEAGDATVKDEIDRRNALTIAYQNQRDAIKGLEQAKASAAIEDTAGQAALAKSKATESIKGKLADSKGSFAEALGKAGEGDIFGAFSDVKDSLSSMQEAMKETSDQAGPLSERLKNGFGKIKDGVLSASKSLLVFITNSDGVGRTTKILNLVKAGWALLTAQVAASGGIINFVKLAFTGLAMSVRVLGMALLNAIPIVGQLIFAFQLLMEYGGKVVDFVQNLFRSDAEKKTAEERERRNKQLEEQTRKIGDAQDALTESIANSEQVGQRYRKYLGDAAVDASKQAQALMATGKAAQDLADKMESIYQAREAEQALKDLIDKADKNGGTAPGLKTALNENMQQTDAYKALSAQYALANDTNRKSIEQFILTLAKLPDDAAREKALREEVNALGKANGEASASITELSSSFTALDKSAQAYSKSIVQTTSVDKLLDDFGSVMNVVEGLTYKLKEGAKGAAEFANQVKDKITPAISGLLNKDTQTALAEFSSKQAIAVEFKARADAAQNKNAEAYKVLLQQSSAATEDLNKNAQKYAEQINAGLIAAKAHLETLQTEERTAQSRITLENARYKAFQRIAGETKESARAEDAHQDKLISLEKNKLSIQMSIIDAQIEGVKAQRQEYELKKKMYELDLKILKAEALKMSGELESKKVQQNAFSRPVLDYNLKKSDPEKFNRDLLAQQAWDAGAKSVTTYTAAIALLNSAIVEDESRIASLDSTMANFDKSLNSQIKSYTDAKKVISSNMEALGAGQLTDEQKRVRDIGLDLKIVQEISGNILEREKILLDIRDKQRTVLDKSLPAIVKVAKYSKENLNNQLNAITIERDKNRQALSTQVATLEAAANTGKLRDAELKAAQAEVALAKTRLTLYDATTQTLKDQVVATSQMQLLELAYVDTTKEGLEIQQKALDIVNSRLDAQQKLEDAVTRGISLEAQIAAKKMGTDVDPELQRQLDLNAAKRSLKIAQEQLQFKIEGIKLEYALLEAQRIQTILDLSSKKKILEMQLRASQDGKLSKEQEVMLGQLTSALNTLGKNSYSNVRDIAIATAQQEVANKRREVELLSINSSLVNSSNDLLSNVLRSIQAGDAIYKERQKGKEIDTAGLGAILAEKPTSVIPDLNNILVEGQKAIESTTDSIADVLNRVVPDFSDMDIIVEDVNAQFMALSKTLTGLTPEAAKILLQKQGVLTSPQTTERAADKKQAALSGVQRAVGRGFSVSEWAGPKVKGATGLTMQHKDPGHAGQWSYDANPAGKSDREMTTFVEDEVLKGAKGIWKGLVYELKGGKVATHAYVPAADAVGNDKMHQRHAHLSYANALTTATESTNKSIESTDRATAATDRFVSSMDRASEAPASKAMDEGKPAEIQAMLANLPIPIVPGDFNTEMARTSSEKTQNYQMANALVSDKLGDTSKFSDKGREKSYEYTTQLMGGIDKIREDLKSQGNLSAEEFNKAFIERSTALSQNLYQSIFPAGGLSEKIQAFWGDANTAAQPFLDSLKTMGPDGELVVSVYSGIQSISTGISQFAATLETGKAKFEDYATVAGNIMSSVGNILAAGSKSKIATIDKEIAAEQKRDGKSAESVAKIAQLQKKKEAEEKKAFEREKKMKMAEAIISTAVGIAKAIGEGNIPKAILVGAMGAAQIAIIASTKYEGGNTSAPAAAMPSTLSIGKRGDSVDLAKGPNASAGGEAGYLRGSQGQGSNASNYRTVGSAYGGDLMRGYGNRGFVVGEKGPEVITPETPITVTPANDTQSGSPINANISIHALDSHGVQDILVSQKGNIIKMLREAANASGKTFMEDVNVNVYTRPSVGKL